MRKTILVALAAFALAPAAAGAQEAPRDTASTNPCADSQYTALRGKALDQMSEREYAYFLQRDRACTEHQRTITATAPARQAVEKSDTALAASLFIGFISLIVGAVLLR